MLDGWGRKRDLPDKSEGKVEEKVLSRQWEQQGPIADDGSPMAPPQPAWLTAAQGGEGGAHDYASVTGSDAHKSDAEEEEARLQWLAWHLQQGEWEKASTLVATEEERDELRRLRSAGNGDA